MARAIYSGPVAGLRGKIGGLIFRQLPDGSIVVSRAKPKMTWKEKEKFNHKRSPRQREHNNNFQEAAAYARHAARTQPVYAELAAASPMKTAYNFALSDWFHPPVIHRVERTDGRILVEASDDIQVTRVRVSVLDGEGKALERGEALRVEDALAGPGLWEFATQSEGKTVVAEAWDLPRHVTRFTLE